MENNKLKKIHRALIIATLCILAFVWVWGARSGNILISLSSVPIALVAVGLMLLFGTNEPKKFRHLFIFAGACVVAWVLCTLILLYYLPHLVNNRYEKAILDQGFSNGPIPVNTLYVEPQALFADPLQTTLPAGSSDLMTTGVNHDTLLVVGWLDLSNGPLVLHVPDMTGRYYSVQFTDPYDVDFAYVGTRTTGSNAGDYLITGPGWKGQVPSGMTQISSPNNSVLVIGRVLVYSDSDVSAAYNLAKQIQLSPLNP